MARMIPTDISTMNFTYSEKKMYNLLEKLLPQKYRVYYSVSFSYQDKNQKGAFRTGEIDFVILNKDFGFLCLEVKGGKSLEISDGIFKLITNENTGQYFNINPIEQARNGMYALLNIFEQETGRKFSGKYCYGICFPNFNLQGNNLGMSGPNDFIIDYGQLDNLKTKIENMFKLLPNREFNDDDYLAIERIINIKRFYGITVGRQIEFAEKKLIEINRVQEAILDLLDNQAKVKIRGGAGTGKTWIAMKKALRCAEKGMRTAFICFNSKLASFVKEMLKQLSEQDFDFPIDVFTYHKMISDFISPATYRNFLYDQEDKDLEKATEYALKYLTKKQKYDAIIVDEGQDFSETWQLLITNLLKEDGNGILYLFYDPSQDIFDKLTDIPFLIETPDYILSQNLRNTKEIHEFAINEANVKENLSSKIDGLEPILYEVETANESLNILKKILDELIKRHLVKEEQIIILSNKRLENSLFNDWKDKINPYILMKNPTNVRQNVIKFNTIQSFKGLESDIVIYLEHHRQNSEPNEQNIDLLKYVAYTRARYVLYVIREKNK